MASDTAAPKLPGPHRKALFGIVLAALVLRVILLFSLPWTHRFLVAGIPHEGHPPPASLIAYLDRRTDFVWFTEDEHVYDEMARAALRGEGFATDAGWMVAPPRKPSSYGGFVYPAFVTVVYALSGGAHQLPVYLLQVVFACTAILPVFRLGRRCFGDTGGVLAAVAFGLSPFVLWSCVAFMTEAAFVPLVTWVLWAIMRAWDNLRSRDWAVAGVLLALSCLTRSTLLYFVPVLFVGLPFRAGLRASTLRSAAVLLGAFLLCVLPWTYRNYRVHHHFLLLDTKAGTNLWQFNNPNMVPELGLHSASGEPPLPITPDVTVRNGGNEVEQDRRYGAMAAAYAKRQPGHFLSVVACRAALALSPTPVTNASPRNVAISLATEGPLLLFAILGWLRLRRAWREHLPLLVLPVYWWVLQAMSGPGLRYRLPVEFAYAVLAAGGALWAYERVRKGRAGSRFSTTGNC